MQSFDKRRSFKTSEWTREVLARQAGARAAVAPGKNSAVPRIETNERDLHWRKHWRGLALSAFAVLVATLMLFASLENGASATSAANKQEIDQAVARALASATPPPPAAAQVYDQVRPSLVEVMAHVPGDTTGFSYGSGFIIDDTGQIMTSLHIVRDAFMIQVSFADGTVSEALLTRQLDDRDIAFLEPMVLPAHVVPAVLGNPHSLRIGDLAIAIGNPMQLVGSLSTGSISGLEREFLPPEGGAPIRHMIQIDTAVNPGNSGGPLLNSAGQVVGVITGRVNPGGREPFIGIGFAVPIDQALGTDQPLPY